MKPDFRCHFSENLLGREIFDIASELGKDFAIEQRGEEWAQRRRCNRPAQYILTEINEALVIAALTICPKEKSEHSAPNFPFAFPCRALKQ